MRVLHIIDSGGMYGAEVMLLNLATEHIRQGLLPIIASIGGNGCDEKAIEVEARKRNIPVKSFRMHPGPNFFGAWRIINYARSHKCELLHSHGYKGNILLGCIPKRFCQLPLISTVHGWTSIGDTFSRMHLYEWFDSRILSRMDAVVLVNKGMLTHPKLSNIKNTFHIINNGISTEHPDDYPCEDIIIRQGKDLKIVAVGRLSPEKGFDILLKALALVAEEGYEVSLTLFGEGEMREKLGKLVEELGLHEQVAMPGFIENVASTFSCFDLLVMPSFTEGLPITLLEAMRAEIPIIASKVGGIPNVIQHGVGGLLVAPGNVKELADSICRLICSEEQTRQFAKQSELDFKQLYSAKLMADSYKQLYATLVA